MEGYPWGGSEELWAGAALWLAKRGQSVGVNVIRWPETAKPLKLLQQAGCAIHCRKQYGRLTRLLQRWTKVNPARRWLGSVRADLIVISQGGNSDGLIWAEYCKTAGLKYVLIVQAVSGHLWPMARLMNRLRAAYTGATHAYFVSQQNLEAMQTLLACKLPNGRVVWNPFKVDYDARLPFPPTDASFRLACVARLDPAQKGQDLLLKVLALEKWRKRNLSVSFVGQGPYEFELHALARQWKLENVRWMGQVDAIEKVWADHHALVMPSRFEGMPLSLIEALICARPAIVTDVGGNAEILQDSVTGFIAAAPTVRLFDQALERAWERRNEWEKMGATGAEVVRARVPKDPCAAFAQELESIMKCPQGS